MNVWHRPMYDDSCATLRTHDEFSIYPLGSITLMVLVGPKAMSFVFVIIPELDLFRVKLGIPWLIAMEVNPSVVYKSLKLPH